MSSRESDNAYPSPRHTGPDAYPSGTPPYGTPGLGNGFGAPAPMDGPAGRQEPPADQDVPKTETTLTTRISINIPGSRPIPPVVVRSTVKPEDAEDGPAEQPAPTGPRHRSGAPASPVLGVMEGGTRTATPPTLPPEWQLAPEGESESTGEWFRPRQKSRPEPALAPAAPAATPAAGVSGLAAGSPYQTAERPPAAPVFSSETSQQIPVPRPTGIPASPFATADDPATATPPAGVPQYGAPQTGYPADPYAAGPADPFAAPGGNPYGSPYGAPQSAPPNTQQSVPQGMPPGPPPGMPGRFARSQPPVEPFPPAAAPAPSPYGGQPYAEGRFATPRPGAEMEPEDTQIGGFEPISGELPPPEAIVGLPVAGGYANAPSPAPPGGGTRTATPPPPPAGLGAPVAAPAPAPAPAAAPAKAKPKPRRTRKLAVYAVAGALFVAAAAYGTGLMLNQADVPRGITVLGTSIGGDSRDQAIHQLDGTVGKIGRQPIKLMIGSQALDLDPTTAGLSFDTTATVDGLTKHSYNPTEVIGSLAGTGKAVPPQVRVDEAKLKAALDQLAAGSAQGLKEGYVQFSDSGDPVVVPGQAGQVVDGGAALSQVEQHYRDRAAGKADTPIALAVTAAQPKVATPALQQAADGLGKAIASGKVTVLAGTKKFVFLKTTAAKTLTLVPDASGAIVPKWALDQLGAAVGGTFDKVKYHKADGTLAAIGTQDVADAIASVYDKGTDAERTFRFHM